MPSRERSAGARRSPAVTVTIVLYNSEEDLAACLESIRPELNSGFADLIAIDNGSPDHSVAIVQHEVPAATVLRLGANCGFAAAANHAWPYAKGRYWMLLNPDAQLSTSGLRVMAEWMDQHPSCGIASAELLGGDGSFRGAGRALPSLGRVLLEASRLHRALPVALRGRILRDQYWNVGDQTDAGWVPGAAMMIRREAVEDVGLLDERFFLHGEDLEWCWRMRSAGWCIGVCSAATAAHRGWSSSSATFTSDETLRRMAKGGLEAVRMARGPRFARTWALAMEIRHGIEARHPRRTIEDRNLARKWVQAWRSARYESRAVGYVRDPPPPRRTARP